jgi:riboflavin synthase
MFTGLIEETGTILQMEPFKGETAEGATFFITTDLSKHGIRLGDSIAINGVCTTVTQLLPTGFAFDASPETLEKTTLQYSAPGQSVNLEKPLIATAPIGGHFVTGHVDTTGVLTEKNNLGNSWILSFALSNPAAWQPLVVPKGSICIDGISLTVNSVNDQGFTVAIIPHTWEKTTISLWNVGDRVNLEFDILGKYIVRFLEARFPVNQVGSMEILHLVAHNEVKQ